MSKIQELALLIKAHFYIFFFRFFFYDLINLYNTCIIFLTIYACKNEINVAFIEYLYPNYFRIFKL